MLKTHVMAVLFAASIAAPLAAQTPTATPPQGPAQAAGPAAPQGGASRLRPFADIARDAVAQQGYLDTYEKDGRLFLAIPRERLGEQILFTTQIARGIGTRGVLGGTMLSLQDEGLVSFERRADRVFLVRHPHRFFAEPGSPMARAVELTFGTSVLESAAIASFRTPDSALVIDATDWLTSDLSDVGARMRSAASPRPGTPGRATLDRSRSYVEGARVFPRNVNLRAKLTFQPGEPVNLNGVPDSRYIPVSIDYSFAALPERPMSPRAADDRMGFFLAVRKNFSAADSTRFFERYVTRWRLEPERREGELWVPKKPIIYYIDRTVPAQYRAAVMAGVNNWQRAFEAAGWKDAIRAEILPDSADPEDIRFATIRWNTSDEPSYGAIGPSFVDPRTGEILDADILVEQNAIAGYARGWRNLANPAQLLEAMLDGPGAEEAPGVEHASFASAFMSHGALLRTALIARGEIGPTDPVPPQFLDQAITWVTMHEVGHTLGLRHNFRSSVDTPLDKLYDPAWVAERGLYGSVMEYPSLNVAPGDQRVQYYYTPTVGTGDRWQIAFGYTSDDARARELARQAAAEGHAFGTDEDSPLDPTVLTFDLSDDPMGWGKQRTALLRELFTALPKHAEADNARYVGITDAFQWLLSQYGIAVGTAVKYIGGQYQYRDHVGDPSGRPPFANVPKARQREAVAFLREAAFGKDAFAVPMGVMQKFGANRWSHWGETNTVGARIDFPFADQVLGVQRSLLTRVLAPATFSRIRDAELRYGPDQVLTTPELMQDMTRAVWSEVYGATPENVASLRRELQRAHLEQLRELVGTTAAQNPAFAQLPADARAVARQQLGDLKRRIDARLAATTLDAYTRAHLSDSSVRIGKILQANMVQQ